MNKLFWETELTKSMALMVIDIDGKTNGELKQEVRRRVRRILNENKKKVIKQQKMLNNIVGKEKYNDTYAEVNRVCKAEFNKIIAQFDCQIDMLKPAEYTVEEIKKMTVEV